VAHRNIRPTAELTRRWRVLSAIGISLVSLARWRVTVTGQANLPKTGGAVVVFNHHSYADFVFVAWPIVRDAKRIPRFLAKGELFTHPVTRPIVKLVHAVPVHRTSDVSRADALTAAIAAAKRGEIVVVAPEQTISRSLDIRPLRTGAVRIAQAANVPIIPVIGFGSQRIITKGKPFRVQPGIPISVTVAEPFTVTGDDAVVVTERLRHTMQTLLDTAIRNYPDKTGTGQRWLPARYGGTAITLEDELDNPRM
jgi:1-acyl-sn-glycerol-3-phosphate acyltransferase